MVLTTCTAPELHARLAGIALFRDCSHEDLAMAYEAARLLTLRPAEELAQKGTVLPGFCLVLRGSLEWAGSSVCLPWVHPARVGAAELLPDTLRAGTQGAECLYVPSAAFLDLLEVCPAWAVAMLEASAEEGTWQ
jgi:hypothetical protein